jgi:DNA-binding NarL/FixJ family response regulator
VSRAKLSRNAGFVPGAREEHPRLRRQPAMPNGRANRDFPLFAGLRTEIFDRLRKGEPNKITAYKLSMGEYAIKVHVRNIMRKIRSHIAPRSPSL